MDFRLLGIQHSVYITLVTPFVLVIRVATCHTLHNDEMNRLLANPTDWTLQAVCEFLRCLIVTQGSSH